jgi:pimeloyl-ACP methyl ester carboxylesterase
MLNGPLLIFIHGLNSSGQGFKGRLLRTQFPAIVTPDFEGSLAERMRQLTSILAGDSPWTIIGSSFGGLMGALYTCRQPDRVRKLILLAPALVYPDFAASPPAPVAVPTLVYHGQQDTVIPVEPVRMLAEQVFLNLTFHLVDDDHRLTETVQALDWLGLVA